MTENDAILTFREACEFAKVGKSKMYQLLRTGAIRGRFIGGNSRGKWIVLRSRIIEWAAKGELAEAERWAESKVVK